MGTRGAIGFKYDGKRLLAYNHFDSYPHGLGAEMLEYATASCVHPAQRDAIKERLAQLVQVDELEKPSEEQASQLVAAGVAGPERVSSGDDWYAWLRDAQGRPNEYLRLGFWPENNAFIEDGLFCEWAYIIDLDAGKFEVYQSGDNKIAEFELDNLPESYEFLASIEKSDV